MYVLVFTRKKRLNTILVTLLACAMLFGIFQVARLFIPETEITLEQRISVLLPSSTNMLSIYMASPNTPAIQTGALVGNKWKTQKIEQQDMSEITFVYPETLRMDEIKNLGPEINIHMNYQHTNNRVFGFFQVWKLNQPLKDFLNASKKYSSMTFLDFKESELKVKDLRGYTWEYVIVGRNGDIVGMEAFIENGNEMYRFAMFVLQEDYKPAYKKIFSRMVNSLRVKGT